VRGGEGKDPAVILVLDNYDSFTYNLVQYLAELGASPEVAQNDAITVDDVLATDPAGIVISPGPGRPEAAGITLPLIAAAAVSIPILGVCLGHHAIALAYGARIGYAPTLMHGKTSAVFHDGSALYDGVPSPFEATRYHSLVVDPQTLPADLCATAWTEAGVVMGLRHVSHALFGVQYHPESILTTWGKRILGNFMEVL